MPAAREVFVIPGLGGMILVGFHDRMGPGLRRDDGVYI
jgi:hypothetical protein